MVGFKQFGIDLEDEDQKRSEDILKNSIDIEKQSEIDESSPSWADTVSDVLTQSGRGFLKLFTWPADVIKAGMIGAGLEDLDELEEIHRKEKKPFNREEYVKSVFDTAQYIPTQDLLEKSIVKGINALEPELAVESLEPKTELGKAAKQGVEIARFSPGSLARKTSAATIGTGTTQALKGAGVNENTAEIIGDLASVPISAAQKSARTLTKEAEGLEKIAQKHSLPFLEYMAKERAPWLKGKLFKSTENRLKESFNLSTKDALNKIVKDELPLKRLQERGVNLDALGEHAYKETNTLAKKYPQQIKTDQIVKNIDNEISRIKSLAPSPSESQRAAIKLLEEERDVLKVSNPTSEQLINQHINYNADMKQIYRKPEFSGKEEQVRKTYEFLKKELVEAMDSQGRKDVANAFKAANKIYHESAKLKQTESLLEKAFKDGEYSPQNLKKLLDSKKGNYLRRNMSESAIQDLEDIAHYGKEAQKRFDTFIGIEKPVISQTVKNLGQLAPMVFLPHNIFGGVLALAKPIASRVQGRLLIRPATRRVYKQIMKDTANGSFNLLKKDFMQLEKLIEEEWGSVDDFMDDMMLDLN